MKTTKTWIGSRHTSQEEKNEDNKDTEQTQTSNISSSRWERTVGQSGEVSQKMAEAYEFAFGSEVAKTAEILQGTSLKMFLKSICEQNLIS